MEKQRKIILEPNGYYGTFRTNYENKIMIETKTIDVGIRKGLDPSYHATDETNFESSEEAFKFIFDNNLKVEGFTTYEGGLLYIQCFKEDNNEKLSEMLDTQETNKENVKQLEQYLMWCLSKELINKCFTIGVKMLNGDLLEINYTPADANQHSDDNRIEINLNDKNISITSFEINEDYNSVRDYVLESLDTVLTIEDGI